MDQTLYEKLISLKNTNEYGFHMPGHKRNETEGPFKEIMKMDITEIEGFDNLHQAEGILKKEQEFVASLYGSKETFFLVNGSTAGVLAAICAVTEEEETILLSRNSHKSAYHALYLKGLHGLYLYPRDSEKADGICGNISPEDVAVQMDKSNAKIVFITSPTYEGILSDISAIADEVHKRDGILIVDEAHGAHLGFHPFFPKSAIQSGADIVVQSMHKTLPSLTQTALLHICSERVHREKISMWLRIFQTSSPSYVLMASISRCLHLLDQNGESLFEAYAEKLSSFYKKIKELKHLKVLHPEDVKKLFSAEFDPSKINICTCFLEDETGKPYRGKELAKDLLEKYQLQMEMTSENYVIAMTSIYDTQEGFDRLQKALFELDTKLSRREETEKLKTAMISCMQGNGIMTIKAALNGKKKKTDRVDCIGKISAEYIYLYPPGSPILVPGERISEEVWKKIEQYSEYGLNIQGPQDNSLRTLLVVEEPLL